MILIVGGRGTLGSLVTTRLLAAGERVRVMSRTPQKAAALRAAGAEVVRGDLLDHRSTTDACAGADVVVAAAHSIFGRGRNASAHVDGAAHRQLIDIARAHGARHLVYTSVYDNGPAYDAVPFFRIKREVERHLTASGLSYTIVRPTAFMDFHAHELIGKPILAKGKVVLFGRGEQPRNFVAADDVAQFVVLAIRDPLLAGETIDVGGPEDLTHLDVVRLYERVSGRTAKVTRVPIGVVRTVSRLVRPVHAGLSQILQAAVLAEERAEPFDARPLMARFPITLTRLEDWVATLGARLCR
jgi:uncharacterized protein YbjT (DUF2867 family)